MTTLLARPWMWHNKLLDMVTVWEAGKLQIVPQEMVGSHRWLREWYMRDSAVRGYCQAVFCMITAAGAEPNLLFWLYRKGFWSQEDRGEGGMGRFPGWQGRTQMDRLNIHVSVAVPLPGLTASAVSYHFVP